jgi:hypothetical protein
MIKIKITAIKTIKKWAKIFVIIFTIGVIMEFELFFQSIPCKNLTELVRCIEMETQKVFEIIQKNGSRLVGL